MACDVVLVLAWHILTLAYAIVAYWRCVRCVGKHFCGIVALPIQFLSNESKLIIYNLAFKIGIAFIDKRSLDARGRHRCETKLFELVDRSPRGVPTVHYLFRQLHRWNIDYAFFGCFHYIEGVRNYIKSDKLLDSAATHT